MLREVQVNHRAVGQFECWCLVALVNLGGKAHGWKIGECLTEMKAQPDAVSQVYATVQRMEKKGYLSSSIDKNPNTAPGGRSMRVYKFTAYGRAALRRSIADARRMLQVFETATEKA